MGKKMFCFNNHFLDSNILLGRILGEEHTEKYRNYFAHDIDRYISIRVKKECENVINRLKRLSLRFISYIMDIARSNQNINLMGIDQLMNKMKMDFIKIFNEKSYYEGLDKEKFVKIVTDLLNDWYDNLKDDFIHGTSINSKKIKNNIKVTYREANKSLKNIFSNLNIGQYYQKEDNNLFEEKIKNIGIHKSDNCILLDCYVLSKNHLNEKVAFITQDQKICENNENLQIIFNSLIEIFDLN